MSSTIKSWIEAEEKALCAKDKTYKPMKTPFDFTDPNFIGEPLWTKCEDCSTLLYLSHLPEDYYTCKQCGTNVPLSCDDRILSLLDHNTWIPFNEQLSAGNPLQFVDKKPYPERLAEAQERTQFQDAIQTGVGEIHGIPVAFAVMNFEFMGGSMGSVVGEKLTRLIEYATNKGLMLIIVCASGGARMQEGTLSLMQMAKVSAALYNYQVCCKLFYISILATPTTGGVTASFAMQADIVIAEPKAVIGFAGRRVIEQTLGEILPDNFQTAEYMIKHGLVDLIVGRAELRDALRQLFLFKMEAAHGFCVGQSM